MAFWPLTSSLSVELERDFKKPQNLHLRNYSMELFFDRQYEPILYVNYVIIHHQFSLGVKNDMTIPNNQFISRHFQRAQTVVASATKGRKSNELTKTIYFPKLCTQTHVILNSQFRAKIDIMKISDSFVITYLLQVNFYLTPSLVKCTPLSGIECKRLQEFFQHFYPKCIKIWDSPFF